MNNLNHQNEEEYQNIFENALEGIFQSSLDGRFLKVNPAMARIYGYDSPEDMLTSIKNIGKQIYVNAQDRNVFLQELQDKGYIDKFEDQNFRKDGSTIWTQTSARIVQDTEGNALLIEGFITDITSRKEAELALKQSEEQFKKIFQTNPIASCIATLEEGRFIAANDAYWKLSGFRPNEFIGRTSIELGFIKASSRKNLVARLKKEKTLRKEGGKLITKSGEIRDTLEFFDLINFDGQDCILSMFYDITEQTKAQQALQENEEKYRQLFEAESDAIFLIDNESGNILDTNAAATTLYGYSKEELLQKKNSDLSAEPEKTRKVTQSTPIDKDQVISIPLRFHKKMNGTIFPVEITGRFFEWRGHPVHIAAIRDITERKKVEEALKTSEERFRLSFQTSPDSININRLKDGLYIDVNEGFTKITGYTREEVIGKTSLEIDIWENPADREKLIEELSKNGFVNNQEAKFRSKDGRVLTGLMSARIITLDGALHIISITREIEAIKQNEAMLQKQLRELTILHNIAIAASSSTNVDDLLQRTTDTIWNTLHPDNCGTELLTEAGDAHLAHQSYRGPSTNEVRKPLPLSKGIVGKVISTGRAIRLGDVTQEPAYIEVTQGVQSELCVPIKIQDRVIGAFNVESKQADAYTESDERLLNTIAGTLATAIEQLRLFETSQHHLQELTTLNAVSLASTRAKNLDELVESVTQIIGESLYPDNFGVLLLNNEATALIPHSSYRGITHGKIPKSISLDQGISGQVATSGKPARIANVRSHKKYIEVTSQVRSELCIPINLANHVLGVINAESVKINAFTQDDEQLLTTIAGTLATAIEKLRLLEEEKKRRLEAEVLLEATNTLTTSLNLDTLFNSILESLSKIITYDSASIALKQNRELVIVAGRGFPTEYNAIGRSLVYSEKWSRMSTSHHASILGDVHLDPSFERWEGSEYIRGWMGVPMVVHGKLIGYINLDSREPNAFTEKDAIIAQTFANSAAVAIENAHLFEAEKKSRERAEALREATAALTTTIELESLYKIILDSVTKLVPFDSASIEMYDQGYLEVVAGRASKDQKICVGERYLYDTTKRGDLNSIREPIIIPNIQKNDRFEKLKGTEYIRGWMGVPLIAQDRLIGFLNFDSSTENFFTNEHAALAHTFGNQAAVAIENARLFSKEQAQRQRNATLLDLMRVVASSLSLEDVMQTILERINELVPSTSGTIQLLDGNNLRIAARIGLATKVLPIGEILPLRDYPLNKKTIKEKVPVYIPDTKEDKEYVKLKKMEPIRAFLSIPLVYKNKAIGLITLNSQKPAHFTEQDIDLVLAVAKHTTIAIENARLFKAEQRRRREAEILRQASSALTSSLELDEVLNTLLNQIATLVPYNSAAVFMMEKDHYKVVAGRGYKHPEKVIGQNFPLEDEFASIVRETRQPFISQNIQMDPRFKHWGDANNIHGWMCFPLVARDQVIGHLTIDSYEIGAYGTSDVEIVMAFANQAALAIQNARQFEAEQRHFQEAETLRQAAEAITSTLDIQQVLNSILDNLNRVIPFDSASVFLIENDNVHLTAVKGMPDGDNSIGLLFPASNALFQEISRVGQTLILKNAQIDSRFEKWVADQVHGWMGVPLIARGIIIGYITIDSHNIGAYNEHDANLATTFAHQAAAAIENARLYERGEGQIRQLTVLRDIDSAISSSFDLRVTLNLLIGYAVRELNVDAIAILLYNSDLKSLSLFTSVGLSNKPSSHMSSYIRIGEGLAGRVVLQRKLVQVPNLNDLTEFSQSAHSSNENFRSYFGVPLLGKGQIKGVMEIYTREEVYPDTDWLNFLHTLAGQAAIAIDNVQLFKNLQRSNQELILAYDTTLAGWGRALELRDKETQGHTDRVVELTVELARRMGVEGDELTHIMRGTLLHDIGKMGIPDYILHKPGPLTEEEWVIMRQHPQYAYNLMNPIPYLRPALEIPYSHHERWDGSGYPRGLKGEDIPLAARIFAVVDIWDALRYERIYRAAWPEEKVLEYLKNTAGIELDPAIVEKFLELLEEDEYKMQAK